MNYLRLQDKTFPVVLYRIQAEVLALSLDLSWQEIGWTQEGSRIVKGCPHDRTGGLKTTPEFFCFTDFHKFLPALDPCGCWRSGGGFTN